MVFNRTRAGLRVSPDIYPALGSRRHEIRRALEALPSYSPASAQIQKQKIYLLLSNLSSPAQWIEGEAYANELEA
ncbi:hypothetical protein NMY22_g19281 [Coprinellus aureogranulatus]|nr:hypothetical protein NMY22_g19281 [Coprinellus aureogranulatus]